MRGNLTRSPPVPEPEGIRLGRGDGELKDWDNLRAQAASAHNARTATYLLGMPLLSDYLDEALAQLGHTAEEFEQPT